MDDLLTFLAIYIACYLGSVALYFAFGGALSWINARNPQRRIQKDRRGEERAGMEMIQSLKALTVNCFCLAGGLFLQWKGWVLFPPLETTWISFAGMFALSVVLYDTWFYWGHRLMHSRVLYRYHVLHHRSIAPTVWSNYSDTLPDTFVMFAFYLVAPLVLPIPAMVLVLHRIFDHFVGQIGHSGFEYFADCTTRYPSPLACVCFHDQHHQHFRYNYANLFSFWDRVCGTLHPEYDETVSELNRLAKSAG